MTPHRTSAQQQRGATASAGESADRSASERTEHIDVVFVGGAGRSGSTVLALLLAQLPGFVAVGGLTNLWERGLQRNYLCGCGVAFRSCGFWKQVGEEAFGGWDQVDAAEVLRLRQTVVRYRHCLAYLAPRAHPEFFARAATYADYTRRVYHGVSTVSGARTVVDNSHDPAAALLLTRTPAVHGHILHLVRDSRGVAFSLAKSVARPEATQTPTYMPRYGPLRAGAEWVAANLTYHFIPPHALPRLRIRYESLVASPLPEIHRILEFLGMRVPAPTLRLFEGPSIQVAANHMISGNPHRLGRTEIELHPDNEWRRKMRSSDRLLTTLVTLPLAVAYGYIGARPHHTSPEISTTSIE